MLAKLRARRTGLETTTPASDDDDAGDTDAAGDNDAVVVDRSIRAILRKRNLQLLESHSKGMKTDTSSSYCVRKLIPMSTKW